MNAGVTLVYSFLLSLTGALYNARHGNDGWLFIFALLTIVCATLLAMREADRPSTAKHRRVSPLRDGLLHGKREGWITCAKCGNVFYPSGSCCGKCGHNNAQRDWWT